MNTAHRFRSQVYLAWLDTVPAPLRAVVHELGGIPQDLAPKVGPDFIAFLQAHGLTELYRHALAVKPKADRWSDTFPDLMEDFCEPRDHAPSQGAPRLW